MSEYKKPSVIIIGSGGHSKVVIDALLKQNFSVAQVIDQNVEKVGQRFYQDFVVQHFPPMSWWDQNDALAIIAIGSNQIRNKIAMDFAKVIWVNSIHPTALVHETALLGKGVYIGANVIIQPDVRIGDHTIINTGSIIEHDVIIDAYCHIAPGSVITGGSIIGEGTFLGTGTHVIPKISIGKWTIVGAGSVVIRDIPDNVKAYGVPCHIVSNAC